MHQSLWHLEHLSTLKQEQSTKSPRHKQKQPGLMELILAAAGYGLPPEEKALKGASVHRKGEKAIVTGDITGPLITMLAIQQILNIA